MNEIIYNWEFNPLEVVYHEESLSNVVNVVHWQYTATYASASIHASDRNIGTVGLETPPSQSFISFEDLTKEMVTEWVVAKLGKETVNRMTTQLSASINNQLFPIKGTLPAPWM